MIATVWQLHWTMFSKVVESPIWTTVAALALGFEILFIVCSCALLAVLAPGGSDETGGRPGHGGSQLRFPEVVGAEDWFVWQPGCSRYTTFPDRD
jgi:hypothetical protein